MVHDDESGRSLDRPIRFLRPHQQHAVEAVENSIRGGSRNVAVSMATGSGKTLTAVALIDRLMAGGDATRVLYLVDSVLRARQTEDVIRGLPNTGGYQLIDQYPLYEQRGGLTRLIEQHPNTPGRYVCIATRPQIHAKMRAATNRTSPAEEIPALPEDLFDMAVIDFSATSPGALDATTRLIQQHFQALVVLFVPTEAFLRNQEVLLAFKYTFEEALKDGATHGRNSGFPAPFPLATVTGQAHRHVFVYAAEADHGAGVAVHTELSTAGIQSTLVSPSEDDVIDPLLQEIRAGDSLVYLLSPDSIGNPWLDLDLGKILNRRGAELVPALLRECPVPMTLTGQAIVDVRRDAGELIDKLKWADSIDLTALDARDFEQMATELLTRIGFTVDATPACVDDSGVDLQAIYHDPSGFGEPTPYLIQIKAAPRARPTIRALRQLVDRLPSLAPQHALVVTSGQLTSVASATLAGSSQAEQRLHILDGPRLEEFLLEYPDLIEKYFLRHGETHGRG
jgi:hypothetical protein